MGFLKQFFADNSHREVDPIQVESALATNSHTIVDVRELDEWTDGHIAGTVHNPLGDLGQRAGELPTDRPIYTVCRSGSRSLVAIDILDASGRTGAKSLAGGVIAWAQATKPMVR